jgi:hypothetical protein
MTIDFSSIGFPRLQLGRIDACSFHSFAHPHHILLRRFLSIAAGPHRRLVLRARRGTQVNIGCQAHPAGTQARSHSHSRTSVARSSIRQAHHAMGSKHQLQLWSRLHNSSSRIHWHCRVHCHRVCSAKRDGAPGVAHDKH